LRAGEEFSTVVNRSLFQVTGGLLPRMVKAGKVDRHAVVRRWLLHLVSVLLRPHSSLQAEVIGGAYDDVLVHGIDVKGLNDSNFDR